jgi:hypothetical protein
MRATNTPSPRAYEDFMNAVLQSGYGTDNSRLSARVLLLRSNDLQRSSNLVVDREFSGKISTRKLIIETAKFNVIRAYSAADAVESIQRFPVLDGIVLDAGLRDRPADEVVREAQKSAAKASYHCDLRAGCGRVTQSGISSAVFRSGAATN